MNYIFIICTLAVGHALFTAITLLVLNRKLSNQLLAFLLVLLSLRVGKSVVGMFLLPEMSYELSTIGVTAMAAIGPTLFILIESLFHSRWSLSRETYLHFLPAAALPFSLILSEWKVLSLAYYIITAHLFIYIGLSGLYMLRNRELFRSDDLKWKWAIAIVVSVCILGLSFALQITVYQPFVYAANVSVAAVIFYGLSLWAIKRSKLFLPESVKAENVTALDELGKQIQYVFESELIFTDASLTVTSLAKKLKVQPYMVSRAVNYFFKKSFSELLIYYRIKKAEQLLLSPESKSYTIEGIAFESGFNTLSAFYAAFKKIHKVTPAQFRQAKGNTNLKIA